MEISGAGGIHSEASSSSVIVQSQTKSEDSTALTSSVTEPALSAVQQSQQLPATSLLHQTQPQSSQNLSIQQSLLVQQPSSSSATSPVVTAAFGRNCNGTMASAAAPSNIVLLQMYRILQRANLLSYYDILVDQGGDDPQQLCDAGEREFLEIMDCVKMLEKPLHVRRFQKALAEWANNPTAFQMPLSNTDSSSIAFSPEPPTHSRSPYSISQSFSPSSMTGTVTSGPAFSTLSSMSANFSSSLPMSTTSSSTSGLQLTPTLTDSQVARLTAVAERVASRLQDTEPRAHKTKKHSSKELEQVMNMSETDPGRMEGIRKYSAIYGRFDCKRRPEKPLTLHEVCVNEAAAQICKFVPALLTRRDELFPLARHVVRDSGFGHSAAIARYSMGQSMGSSRSSDEAIHEPKRLRLPSNDDTTDYGKEFTNNADEMRHNLLAIYQKLGKTFEMSDATRFTANYSRSEFDDNESRFSFSSSGSPQLHSSNGGDNDIDEENKGILHDISISPKRNNNDIPLGSGSNGSPHGIHVLSASGNHIIAVANPALALSPALVESINIKRETPDE